ncbi:zinc knuckle [Cooperia oncophora]
MQRIVDALDAQIATEERINSMVSSDINRDTERCNDFKKGSQGKTSHNQNCTFCGSIEHRTASCSRYSTITERRNFLQEHGMCLNCGREGHFASNCTKEGCRNCQGKKHFSRIMSSEANKCIPGETVHAKNANKTAHPIQFFTTSQGEQDTNKARADCNPNFTVSHQGTPRKNVFLLTGVVAHIWNTKRQELQSSFISQRLTKDLGLECMELSPQPRSIPLGANNLKIAKCAVTSIELWDNKGRSAQNAAVFNANLNRKRTN